VTQLFTSPSPALQAAFIDCHSEGHQWRHEGRIGGSDPGARPPFGEYDSVGRVSSCASCGSSRTRWHTRSGEAVNRYDYAEGYTHRKSGPDDEPAPTRLQWRQQLVISLFADMGAPISTKRKRAAS
jgi:hypothetical protein